MLGVLQTVPGVSEPKLDYLTRDGQALPFLEYRAAERNSWREPTHFAASRDEQGQYSFLGLVPLIVDPRVGHMDIHVTEEVVTRWRALCHVKVSVVSE